MADSWLHLTVPFPTSILSLSYLYPSNAELVLICQLYVRLGLDSNPGSESHFI